MDMSSFEQKHVNKISKCFLKINSKNIIFISQILNLFINKYEHHKLEIPYWFSLLILLWLVNFFLINYLN